MTLLCLSFGMDNVVMASEQQNKEALESFTDAKIFDEDDNEVKKVTPFYYKTEAQLKASKVKKYAITAPKGSVDDLLVPAYFNQKGIVLYNIVAKHGDVTMSGKYQLSSDIEGKVKVATKNNRAYIPKAGTYYIRISSETFSRESDSRFLGIFAFVSNSDTTLKNKVKVVSSVVNAKKPIFYKVTVKKNTKLQFELASDGKASVTLCNKKKSALTNANKVNKSGKMIYALNKGTYYLKVSSTKGFLTAKATMTPAVKEIGTKQSSALNVNINKKASSGLVYAKDKKDTVYWFCLNNEKDQPIYMNVATDFTFGKVKMEVVSSEGKNFGSKVLDNGLNRTKRFTLYSKSEEGKKLPKGTYYIKFTKVEKNANGVIQVGIKNR